MFLRRIELQGFKSFADKTVFDFGSGMTAIVGPNGCGKSNVVEAVRWVLGEQRPSTLRSKSMGDIVFSGSAGSKPVSMAQVTLILDNEMRNLPMDTDEILISRRLYRDGQSRYLLNMRPCMLKDIKGVLYNSGLGAPEYAIMQREMIDLLLANKGNERRLLMEEASGILRYRATIKQALNRLSNAENTILRLNDIVSERGRLVRRLRSEAGKAKRLKTLRERLVVMKRKATAARLHAIDHELKPLRASLSRSEREAELFTDRLTAAASRETAERLKLQELEDRLGTKRGSIAALREEMKSFESAIGIVDEKLVDVTARNAELQAHLQNYSTRQLTLRNLIGETASRVDTLESQQNAFRKSVEKLRTCRNELEKTIRMLDREARRTDDEYQEAERRDSSLRHDSEKAEIASKHAEDKVAKLEARRQSLTEVRDEAGDRLGAIDVSLTDLHAREESITAAVTENAEQLRVIDERVQDIRLSLDTVSTAVGSLTGKRDILARMLEEREGYAEGPRFIMGRNEESTLMLLGEEIVPDPGYERAVHAALSEAVEYLVAEDRQTARRLIKLLNSSDAGVARIVELPRAINESFSDKPDLPPDDSIVAGPGITFIRIPTALKPLMEALLGTTIVLHEAPGDEMIHSLWAMGWKQLVTKDGAVFRSSGIHQGGRPKAEELLGRKERLNEVNAELDELVSRRSVLIEDMRLQEEERNKEKETRSRLMESIHQLEMEREKLQTERMARDARRAEIQDELDDIKEEISREHSALESARRILGGYSEKLRENQRIMDEKRVASREAHAALQKSRLKLQGSDEELRGKERELTTILAELNAARGEAERWTGELEKETDSVPGFEEELTKLTERQEELRSEKSVLLKKRSSAEGKVEELEKDVTELSRERGDLLLAIRTLADSITEERKAANESDERRREIELAVTRLDIRREELLSRAMEEQGINESHILQEEVTLTLEELRVEIEKMQERILLMGSVNLSAEEQYREEADALEALQRELEDVQSSRDELLKGIDSANRTARRQFMETWDRVNTHFSETFSGLFPGGKAWLELDGEGSVLSRDISISVQPPGKRKRPVELLSGGERALTALAFMFALYKERAGPVCILDEVDAPLDDANISRFLAMLEELSTRTQFVIVTHNKHTMAQAEQLLGVTMNRGVSRLVTVKLNGKGSQWAT